MQRSVKGEDLDKEGALKSWLKKKKKEGYSQVDAIKEKEEKGEWVVQFFRESEQASRKSSLRGLLGGSELMNQPPLFRVVF